MKLSLLPTEILADIVAYLTALPTATLWISGDKLLQKKLGPGGAVRRFILRPPELLRIFWPSIVAAFSQLTCFHLSDRASNAFIGFKSRELLTLPKTITELSLNFVGALPVFQEAFLSSHGESQYESLLSLDIDDRVYQPNQGDSETGPTLWPRNLTSLSLSTCHSLILNVSTMTVQRKLKGRFRMINLDAGLPKSLESLELVTNEAEAVISQLHTLPLLVEVSIAFITDNPTFQLTHLNLPPKVTYVSLPFSNFSPELLQMLPRSIETIYANGNFEETLDDRGIRYWPPRLKAPTLLLPPEYSNAETVDKDMLLVLHSKQLETLGITILAQMLPYLPPSIQTANISGNFREFAEEMKSLGLQKLPPQLQLKSLNFQSAQIQPFDEDAAFFLAALPDSLTLLFTCFNSVPAESMQLFPRNLRRLNIVGGTCDVLGWPSLPPHLTFLCLNVPQVGLLDPKTSLLLPRTLDQLHLTFKDGTSLGKEWFAGLPKCLKYLFLNGSIDPGAHDWQISLPVPLMYFSITFTTLPNGGLIPLFKSLPRVLASLSVLFGMPHAMGVDSQLQDSDLSYLPKYGLSYLCLPRSALLTQAGLQYLPKTITSFVIGYSDNRIGVQTCPWFTPYLWHTATKT